ncbi:MAG TPA: hypothetical protein VNJ02_20115 [Vicinamibacterales bacterium]|nr:hypothetical protein [Vicinamibacterales bacterium]
MTTISRRIAIAIAAVGLVGSHAYADQVSGRITRTYLLVEDTDLTGDVSCEVENAPCLSFGAPNIELRLNGFTITGRADAATGCGGASFPIEAGISTNRNHGVGVRGPGMIQRTRGRGVIVTGSNQVRIQELTVSTTCSSGIFVAADSFGALIQDVVAVRNGASAPGNPCGGI